MYLNTIFTKITENISNEEVQLKLIKQTKNPPKIEERNKEPRDNPIKNKAAIRWSHIIRWKQTKTMERSAKKTLGSPKITKLSDVYYFNQLVEAAYSTDGEQNAQCQSKSQCQQVVKQMPQLFE